MPSAELLQPILIEGDAESCAHVSRFYALSAARGRARVTHSHAISTATHQPTRRFTGRATARWPAAFGGSGPAEGGRVSQDGISPTKIMGYLADSRQLSRARGYEEGCSREVFLREQPPFGIEIPGERPHLAKGRILSRGLQARMIRTADCFQE